MTGTGAGWEGVPHELRGVGGSPAAAADCGRRGHDYTHRGPYEKIDAAHQAVLRWCAAQRHEITGERWEVYGDWHEDPAQLQTMVFYRLR